MYVILEASLVDGIGCKGTAKASSKGSGVRRTQVNDQESNSKALDKEEGEYGREDDGAHDSRLRASLPLPRHERPSLSAEIRSDGDGAIAVVLPSIFSDAIMRQYDQFVEMRMGF